MALFFIFIAGVFTVKYLLQDETAKKTKSADLITPVIEERRTHIWDDEPNHMTGLSASERFHPANMWDN